MISSRSRWLVVLLLLSAAGLFAQSRPLNNMVRVMPRASSPVPEDCEEGVAQQPIQRAQREELQVERDPSRDLEPPPSRDLRSHLQSAQSAAERNDREGFRAAQASAKSLLSTYPPGGERTAASDVITVYNDLDRLWEYQFTSPTGAFFSAATESGALLTALTKYRGYDDFIRPQTVVDATGTRFYPTRESRDFLVREAADRLTRLGFPPPPPRRAPTTTVARETPARTLPATTTQPPPRREPQPSTTRTEPRRTETTARAEPPRRRSSPTRRTQTASPPRSETRSEPQPSTATIEDIPLPPPVVSTSASTTTTADRTQAPAATETTAIDTSATTASMPEPMTGTTDTSATDMTATETAPQPQPPARTRSVLLPLMLIIIGAGVLILLFRASS